MKDLSETKNILVMPINRDRVAGKIYPSWAQYVEKVLKKFNMQNVKPVSFSLDSYFKLFENNCLSSNEEQKEMRRYYMLQLLGVLCMQW